MANPISVDEIMKNFNMPGTIEYGLRRRFGKDGKDFALRISFGKKEATLAKTGEKLSLQFAKECYGIDKSLDFYSIRVRNADQQQVGILKYNFEHRGHEAFLLYIAVTDASYQGLGVGSLMISEFENIAMAAQTSFIEGCYLPMGRLAKFAKPFYDKHGYTIRYDLAINHAIVYKELCLASPKKGLTVKQYRLYSNVNIESVQHADESDHSTQATNTNIHTAHAHGNDDQEREL